MRKYELTDETKTMYGDTVLHRIRAVRDLVSVAGYLVNAGDLGGWIENESNLSHDGKAWVSHEACVFGSARVTGDAKVGGSALVYEGAGVGGSACVCSDARIHGRACVCGNAWVGGSAKVCGAAMICDSAWVGETTSVCGSALVGDSACIFDDARIDGEAWVRGSARVCGNAHISGDARVSCSNDYAVFKNTWSSGRFFTYTRSNGMWTVGCFHGTGKELIAKAYKDSDLSGKCYEAIVRVQEAIDREIIKDSANERRKT